MAMAKVTEHCMKMQIPEISKLNAVWSPKISIHGIPWNVKVCKMVSGHEPSMGVYLYCGNKDETLNWSLWGSVSIKLFSFSDKVPSLEYHSSAFIFDRSGAAYGRLKFIGWNDLFDAAKSYVQNDTIKLEVIVKAEDPNDPNRSRLNFKCIDKCCENAKMATYRLTVNNIANFMAVRSPQFALRGLMWAFLISKESDSRLGVLLLMKDDSVSCQITMSIKLLSPKEGVQPNELNVTRNYNKMKVHCVKMVSWDELMKPGNEFVGNNSITLEIELNAAKPEIDDTDVGPDAKRAKFCLLNKGKSVQMECAVCLESIDNQELASTPCGHLFCFKCIKKEVSVRGKCPTCTTPIQLNSLRELYLPTIN